MSAQGFYAVLERSYVEQSRELTRLTQGAFGIHTGIGSLKDAMIMSNKWFDPFYLALIVCWD